MAGKVVDVTLRLIDKMTSPLNALGGKLAQSANQWTKAGKQIQNAGKAISNVGSTMTKSLTVPIATAGAACVKLAAEFEAGMSKVQSISGATGDEIDALSQKAKEMGAKTKFSATEATEAYSYMAMAGWKAADMAEGIEGIMYLAGATGEDLATTSDIVTDALTAFGMSASDTERFVDVLAVTSSNANTNVSMLGESFKYVAPVAGALGYNVEDVSVALGVMANAGIKASTAGTSLRSLMTNLSKPTDSMKAAMEKLNISLTDSSGEMKSFDVLMREMRSSFSGLSESQKAQYAATLAGKSGMSGMLALINASDEDFNKLTEAVNGSTGACQDMYEVANDNLQGQLTILKSTIESVAISFGERMTPYVKQLTTFIQKLADKFNSLTDSQRDTIIKIGLIVAAIGPALLVFGKTVTAVGKVVSAVGAVGRAFRTFGSLAGIIASPAGIVIGVLALLAVGAYAIYKNWDKLKPTFEKIKASFMDLVAQIKPTIQAVLPKAIEFLKGALDGFVKFVGDMIPVVVPIISKALKTVASLIKASLPTIKEIAKTAMSVGQTVIKLVGQILKAVMPVVKQIFSTVLKNLPTMQKIVVTVFKAMQPAIRAAIKIWGQMAKIILNVAGKAITAIGPILQKMGNMFEAIFPKVLSVVSSVVTALSKAINKLQPVFKTVFNVVSSVVSGFGSTISGVFDGVKTYIGGVIDFITGVFSGNWKKAWEGVRGILTGVFSTFGSIIKAPINAIINAINGALRSINSISIPDWVPGVGGKSFSMPTIPTLAVGTDNWKGGIVQISERGGEIVDLPQGSRVYPHDKSVQQAYKDGAKSAKGGSLSLTIPKLADQIIVREEADIDRIVTKLANKLELAAQNLGGGEIGYTY